VQIAAVYDVLLALAPTPVIALNRAAARAMALGAEEGLREMDALATELSAFHVFHAARADLLRRLGRRDEAATAYRRALELVTNDVERRYLSRRLEAL
jgi:RNA polymerase sigma-70 factor, ECF subfamily